MCVRVRVHTCLSAMGVPVAVSSGPMPSYLTSACLIVRRVVCRCVHAGIGGIAGTSCAGIEPDRRYSLLVGRGVLFEWSTHSSVPLSRPPPDAHSGPRRTGVGYESNASPAREL